MKNSSYDNPLLAVHHGALGDVMTAVPSLIKLKNAFPAIDVICQPQNGKLLQELKICRKWYSSDSLLFTSLYSGYPNSEVIRFLKPFQEILLFSFSEKIGQAFRNAAKRPVRRIPPRPAPDMRLSVADYIFQQIRQTCAVSGGFPSEVYDDKRNEHYNRRSAILHPGSGSRKKNWHVSNFIRLYHQISSSGMTPSVILGPADRHLASEFQQIECVSLQFIDDITDLIQLLKNAGRYIGNDSGVSHLASYIGVTSTVIFGPSDPVRWKPVGRDVTILQKLPNCTPCFEFDAPFCSEPSCFDDISPETVFASITDRK